MSVLPRDMYDEALVAWIGDEFPRSIRAVLDRIVNEFEPTLGVEQGWWPLLVHLDAQLSTVDPDYRLSRVTAASGELVVELEHSAGPEALEAAIAGATDEAAHTCEICGAPGKPRNPGETFFAVLCDEDTPFVPPQDRHVRDTVDD